MKAICLCIALLSSVSANATETRKTFLVTMTIVASCRMLDFGVERCTTGMLPPTIKKSTRVFNVGGESYKRSITEIIYKKERYV